MVQVMELLPGVTLRCVPAERFKQGCLSVQFLRPMKAEEAAINALIPAVLLRGTESYPDLRSITLHLDDLYGACVSTLVRRIGDYQGMGLYCGFIEDRYALSGDRILEPIIEFLGELFLRPVKENGVFNAEFIQSEKRNLISSIEAERNDKRTYAASQMLRKMCAKDSFGVPRLGDKEQVEAITPESAWKHYQRVLRESPVEIFYVGSAAPEAVADRLRELFGNMERQVQPLPAQTPFQDGGGGSYTETMEIAQGKLSMGFVTDITNRVPEFASMQVLNTVFGAGMTSKLFVNVREKQSLCYFIGSGYYGSKGIMTVSAGIDCDKDELVKQEVLKQLKACQEGQISQQELSAGKQAILSALRGVYDSPGSIEGYETSRAIGGLKMSLEEYRSAVEAVTAEQVAAAARTVRPHTTYFLKGVDA